MQETYASEVNIPTFTEHPESVKVLYGDTVKFKVTASGTNLKYQWQYKPSTRNGTWTNTGSNSNELSVLATDNDEYLYRCLISDSVYSGDSAIQSNAASLHIITDQIYRVQYITETPVAPEITIQPQPVQTVMGSTATFTVEAIGDNLVYQWQYKPSVLNGTWTNATEASAKTNTYTTSALTFANTGYEYRCIVRDNDGYYYGDQNAVTSDSAMVRVIPEGYTKVIYINESYNITAHPTSRLVLPGESVTFSVVAEGNTELTYRWLYKTTEENSTWTEVPSSMGTGAQTDTLVINKVLDEYDNYMFRCSVGGSIYVYEKSLLSNVAYLMTIEPQQIVTAQYKPSFSVNGTYYPFLQSAYDAIEGTEGTIVVYEDAEDDSTIVIEDGKNITIDTNGKTLTLTTAGITNNGTLTIDGTGTIKTTNNAIDSVVYNNGTLNVVNGTIEGPKNVVYNASTGNLTVGASGGSVSTSSPALIGGTYGVNSETGFNFYDGVMKGTTAAYNGEILEIEDEYTLLETSETVNSVTKQVAMLQMEITPSVMITEWTIPEGGATIQLPVAGTGLNVTIDWGDGTSETWTDTTKFPEHTYTNTEKQKFDIKVRGTVPTWGYTVDAAPTESGDNSKYYTYTQYLTGLKQWGELGANQYGFSNCVNLTYVSGDATTNTFDSMNTMYSMFNNCTSLKSLDLRNFNTSNVGNMRSMFKDCKSLTTLDVSNFDVSKVNNMEFMFRGCEKLESLNVDGFYPKVTVKVNGIFADCTSLTTLDISKFNTENVNEMGRMFQNCTSLIELNLDNINTSNVNTMYSMFEGCKSLTNIDLSNFDTEDVTNMQAMFQSCSSLTEIDVSTFDTTNVENMDRMFNYCSSLTEIDVSTFDTTNVENMDRMFNYCSSLMSLDLSNFDTLNVKNFAQMFMACTNLKSVNLTSFNTSNATNMYRMFYGTGLEHIDLSNFNTSKVTNMQEMFRGADAESIDMSNFNTSSVTTMNGMYNSCKNLKSILISDKFVISGDTTNMFQSCTNLSAIITTSSTPVANQFNGVFPATATFYVPNGSESAYADALSGDTSVTAVAPIIQPIGEANTSVQLDTKYTDQGYTIAGFTKAQSAYYECYGFKATVDNQVNTAIAGVYDVNYNLTRTYTSGDEVVTSNPMKAVRTVEVIDKLKYMITEWNVKGSQLTISLPVSGEVDIMVDWGDDSEIEHIKGTFGPDSFPTHPYSVAKKYEISIKGTLDEWGYNSGDIIDENSPYYTYCGSIVGLKQWGELGTKRYGFAYCGNLTYVSGNSTEDTFKDITSMEYMFLNCSSLKSLELIEFNAPNVRSTASMFAGCSSITRIDLRLFDMSNVEDFMAMFEQSKKLETVIFSENINTSKVKDMSGMFYNCNALKEVDVSKFDTSNVTSMEKMFTNCKNLVTLDVSGFDTSKVRTFKSMFDMCLALETIDVSGFDTSSAENMNTMFEFCVKVKELDVSNFDTSNVTDMGGMFNGLNITELDVSNFDTSNVRIMSNMIVCPNVLELDVSNFDTSKVTTMMNMFNLCKRVTKLDVSNFDTSNVENMNGMFKRCSSLTELNLSNFDTKNVTDMGYMFYDCNLIESLLISKNFVVPALAKDMFSNTTTLNKIIITSKETNGSQFATSKDQMDAITFYVPNESVEAYREAYREDFSGDRIKPILQQVGNKDIVLNIGSDYTDAGYTVAGFTSDESDYYTVYGYSATASGDVDTYKEGTYPIKYDLTRTVTNASGDATTTDIGKITRNVEIVDKTSFMITEWTIPAGGAEIKLPVKGNGLDITIDWGDGTITKVSGDLTVENFPTHTYTNTEEKKFDIAIRGNCPEFGYSYWASIPSNYSSYRQYLTGLKQWGRLNATRYGFAGCTNLTYISGDATSDTFNNITNMSHMFYNCTSLESIDLSKFKTARVTDMSHMFQDCSELTSLNVSSFDTSNVTNMSYMFQDCSLLTSLNLSNFNTIEVKKMVKMFQNCSNITSLNLINFNTSNVSDMTAMFNKCSGLTTLYIDKFNTKNVSNMSEMFRECSNLTTLNVSNFNTENVTRMDNMFYRCSKLTELDVSNFNTSKVENMNGMFLGCSKLDELDVSSFNTSNVTKMVSMFSACNDLTSLDLSNFDTTKVIDMSYMLSGLEILETVDISGFTTSGDTNMELMFQDNPNLKSIQISNKFVIPETATNMFNGCTNLSAIITVSDTPKENQFSSFATVVPSTVKLYVPNGSEEAYIETISGDISGDKIAPVLQMKGDSYVVLNLDDDYVEDYYTVAGFTKDEASAYTVYGYNVNMSGDVDTSNLGVYNVEYTLTRTYTSGDEEVTTPPKTETREVEVTDKSLWMVTEWTIPAGVWVKLPISGDVDIVVDWGDDSELQHIKGTFTSDNYPEHYYEKADKYDIAIRGKLDEWGNTELMIGNIPKDNPYYSYLAYLTGLKQWGELEAKSYGFSACSFLKYVSGDATKNTFKNLNSMKNMFNGCYNLISIDLSNFDTSKVTNMLGTFGGIEKITYLDLSSFDTSKVDTFLAMFESCLELKNIKFGEKFTTDSATDMTAMFNNCYKLESLDLSMFNTSNVKTMEAMFFNCNALTNINLDSFDTSSCEKMRYMFSNCYKLTNLNVNHFDTKNVKNMEYMFDDCRVLTELDLSNFDGTSVENIEGMFYKCYVLSKVDLSNFETPVLKNPKGMFAMCFELKELNIQKLNTFASNNMYQLFTGCMKLVDLNLTNFDTENVENMINMFVADSILESILITNKFVVPSTNTENMFNSTSNLNAIIITSEETNGSQFATVKDQMEGKTFYVPNASVDAYREAFSGDYSGDKVQPILQLLGKEKVNILMGNPYEEMNYTVAGFGIDEIERYLVYGYNVEISGEVDIWQAGEYKLDYILTRTYQNASGETVEEKNVATRIVTVYDKPILTLYENGELYDGEWTSNNIVGVMELLAPESTWISVKAGNSEWTVNPQYAEIVKSGDEMTITFTESMGEYVYVREIDTKGHATTYETSGDMIKIDREAPIIKNFHGETKDKLLNIVAAVSDDVSGIKEYVVTETTVFPREWQAYDSGDISYPVPNSGIYYLWLKDNANNISSGEIYATRDVIPPRGIIEIEPVNILSGDGFKNIIVVNKDKISGEKYTNKDTVNIDIHITDNETDEEELMFALYNEDEYTAVKRGEKRIEWRQYVPRVEWPLPQDEGDYVVYAIFKDNAGNESMTLGEFADQALTTYVVHHYLENPNDTGYSAYEISTEIGRAGVAVDVNSIVKEIPGAIYEKASLRLDGVATTSIVVEGDGTTEVYLHYKRTRHELVLNSNEAIASVNTAGMYKWGQTVILEATLGNDIAYNYGFTNWVVNSGDVTIVEPEKLRTQFRMPSGDVEITAIGTKDIKTFTINFNANGGEVTPASKTLEYYESYGELPTPTRNGYDFIGWYTSPTGGEEIDTTIAPNSNRTIYAHWHSLLLADYVDVGQYVNLGINYSNVPTASTTTQTPTLTGWRVLSVDNGNDGEKYVRLVSAGIPLTYVHKYGSTGDGELSENNLTTGFFDIPLNKTTATDYQFHRSGFGSSVTNNTTLKQVFLNNDYIAVDENGTPKVQSMTLSDVQSIYNIHKTGTVGNETYVNDAVFDQMLSLKCSDSSNSARYHLATEAFENYLWCSYNSGAVVYSGGEMGVRPVVTLRADVIQKGQNANGVWQIGFDE